MRRSIRPIGLNVTCLLLAMCHLANAVGSKPRVDLFPECDEWAARGDCRAGGRP